jgi:hypothetical protein
VRCYGAQLHGGGHGKEEPKPSCGGSRLRSGWFFLCFDCGCG